MKSIDDTDTEDLNDHPAGRLDPWPPRTHDIAQEDGNAAPAGGGGHAVELPGDAARQGAVEQGADAPPGGETEAAEAPSPPADGIALAVDDAVRTRAQAEAIIKNHVIASMAVGLVPLPVFDTVALTNVQFNLIASLADHYGVDMGPFKRTLVTSLLTGSLPVAAVCGAGSLLKLMPGFGTLAGGATVTIMAGAISFATGRVFQRHFDVGGTFEDLRPETLRGQFRQELEEGKRVARRLRGMVPGGRAHPAGED
jgi:uncharacterized protein (DUF697 family)